MWFFKKRTKNPKIKVVLDIRSSSVAAAVITTNGGENPPSIHWTKRLRVFLDDEVDVNNLAKETYKKIDDLLKEVVSKGIPAVRDSKIKDRSVSEVCCVFASPWYESRIRNFDIKDKGEIHFTKEYLNKILKKEQESDRPIEGRSEIDKKILSVLMNGYETDDPFNKKANSLTLSFYSSFVSNKTKSDIEEHIKEHLNTNKIHLSTHPLVTISAIKSIFHYLDNFILIDVGGEVTDISLFKNSMLSGILTVPQGINSFIRNVSEKCSLDKENAISQLNVISDGRYDKKCVEPTTKVINETKVKYLKSIADVIHSSWKSEAIPPTIFVTVDNEASSLMKKVLTSKEAYVDTFKINREPILHIVNNKTVEDLALYAKGTKSDALLSIISNYFVNI